MYMYAFSRRFYPKRLTVHSGYTVFVSMCSLGIEPTTFVLLTQCSTTEPQEQIKYCSFELYICQRILKNKYHGSLIELSRDITEISPLWELLPFNLS